VSNAEIIWASLIKLGSKNAAFNGHVYVKLPRKVVIALRIPPDKKAKRSKIIRRSVTSFWYRARERGKKILISRCDFVYGNARLAAREEIHHIQRRMIDTWVRAPHELLC
jgi:hypothetical protein